LLIEHHQKVLATAAPAERCARAHLAIERLQRESVEEAERLRRINASLPPASSFEGRLQRWREALYESSLEVVWDGRRGSASLTSVDRCD
jgi:hypothetical protein